MTYIHLLMSCFIESKPSFWWYKPSEEVLKTVIRFSITTQKVVCFTPSTSRSHKGSWIFQTAVKNQWFVNFLTNYDVKPFILDRMSQSRQNISLVGQVASFGYSHLLVVLFVTDINHQVMENGVNPQLWNSILLPQNEWLNEVENYPKLGCDSQFQGRKKFFLRLGCLGIYLNSFGNLRSFQNR